MGMKRVLQALREMGFERTRVAVALLPQSLFTFLFLMNALLGPPVLQAAFFGLAACYLLSFLALASEWFWARWFASGLGWFGAMTGLFLMVQPETPEEAKVFMGIFGGLHALIVVMLMGKKMAARYEMQPGWRERFGMDDYGVTRLGKAVTRASCALPGLLLWALGPRNGQGMLLGASVVLGVVGLTGLLRLRTWGLLALGGAGAAVLLAPAPTAVMTGCSLSSHVMAGLVQLPGLPNALSLLCFAATLPFAGGALRYFRSLAR
jgi:hypothetical protein